MTLTTILLRSAKWLKPVYLISEPQRDNETLAKVIDLVNEKYGEKSITTARQL